jgi:hypothetical protein
VPEIVKGGGSAHCTTQPAKRARGSLIAAGVLSGAANSATWTLDSR